MTFDLISNLIYRVEKGIREYGPELLLGSIEISEDEYQHLKILATDFIEYDNNQFRNKKSAIISLALINFAIREYENGQFWNETADKFNCDRRSIEREGKAAIEKFLAENRLYFHVGNVNKGYVTTILAHGIIPNSSLTRFLDFLQDLYFKDLEEDYNDKEVDELLQYMLRLFTKSLDDEDLSITVQGSKMTIARQQLPKPFRIAYVKSSFIVIPIIERLLYYINQKNYGEYIEYLAEDRFDLFFSKLSNFETNSLVQRKRKVQANSGYIKKFHTAQYLFEKDELKLVLPRQIIESEHVAEQLYVEVMLGGNIKIIEELILTKSRIIFKTEQTIINLPEFHNEISYRLLSGNNIIYSSKQSLYREFIMVDFDGNEKQPKNISDETIKIIAANDTDIETDDAEKIVNHYSNFKVVTLFLNEDTLIYINDKVLSTNVASVTTCIDNSSKYNGASIEYLEEEYSTFSKNPKFKFRIRYGKAISDYIISINTQNYSLDDACIYEISDILDGIGDVLALFTIKNEFVKYADPVRVIIREKGTNLVYLQENIFIMSSLNYSFNKAYYYKEKEATLLELAADNIELVSINHLPLKINIKKQTICKVLVKFQAIEYILNIKIPKLNWRLGSFSSEIQSSNHIWWEDISEKQIYIDFPYKSDYLHLVTDSRYEILQGKKVDERYRFTIGQFLQKGSDKSLTLGVMVNGVEETITNIYFEPRIVDFNYKYNHNNHFFSGLYAGWEFCGTGELFAELKYLSTSSVIKTYHLQSYENIIDKDLFLYYGEHEIVFYQLIKDNFFGGNPEKVELLQEKFIVGDTVLGKCKNKILKGIECICDSEKYKLGNFYLRDLRFGNRRGYYVATGFYYINDRDTGEIREWFFTRYNPFILKCTNFKSNEIEFEILDHEEDGLIYDSNTMHINPKLPNNNRDRYKLVDTIVVQIIS